MDPRVLEARRAAQSRAIIVDSETDGMPAIPSAAETAPSCIDAAAGELGVLLVQRDRQADEALVLERPAHDPGAADRQAVVGEADRAGVASSAISVSSSPRHAPGDAWRRSRPGPAPARARCSRSAATSAAVSTGGLGVRHRDDPAEAAGGGGAGCRSRRPPCPRWPGRAQVDVGVEEGREERAARRPRSPRRRRPRPRPGSASSAISPSRTTTSCDRVDPGARVEHAGAAEHQVGSALARCRASRARRSAARSLTPAPRSASARAARRRRLRRRRAARRRRRAARRGPPSGPRGRSRPGR